MNWLADIGEVVLRLDEVTLALVVAGLLLAWFVFGRLPGWLVWGGVAVVVVLIATMLWFGLSRRHAPDSVYKPVQLQNGRIVPGNAPP